MSVAKFALTYGQTKPKVIGSKTYQFKIYINIFKPQYSKWYDEMVFGGSNSIMRMGPP